MTIESWIAVIFGVATLIVNLCTLGVGYGVLRGTVNALKERIVALEKESESISDLKALIARIDERTRGTDDTVRDLNRRLGWATVLAPLDSETRKP